MKRLFFSRPDPSRIWKLLMSEYRFHGNVVICHKFNKSLFSLWSDTIGNIGYITKDLTGMSYLRETCIDSGISRQHLRNKDWTLWNKTTWKYWPDILFTGFQATLLGKSWRSLIWQAQGTSIFRGNVKRREEFIQI